MRPENQNITELRTKLPAVGMLKHLMSRLQSKAFVLAGLALVVGFSTPGNTSEDTRELASLAFPKHRATTDVDDILSDYPDYLRFAIEAGKSSDSLTAKRLADTYQTLRKRHPQGAARFLKGLRFEMIQKLELMGAPPSTVTTNTPEIRRWVGKYLKAWYREADEYLFRAIALR